MRLHIGVAMARQGRYANTAIIATEHQDVRPVGPIGTPDERQQIVRAIVQTGPTVEAARDMIVRMVNEAVRFAPCVFIDGAVGGGMSLYQALRLERSRGNYPALEHNAHVHGPHVFMEYGRGRQQLLDAILTAYASDRLFFQEGLPFRKELAKALAARNATVAEDGIIATSSDEALVTALGLSIRYTTHGHPVELVGPDGRPLPSRMP